MQFFLLRSRLFCWEGTSVSAGSWLLLQVTWNPKRKTPSLCLVTFNDFPPKKMAHHPIATTRKNEPLYGFAGEAGFMASNLSSKLFPG